MAVHLCNGGEVFREEMAFELGLTTWVGVYHTEKGGKNTPRKEIAYGKTHSLNKWHIQRMVRSSLWLKRRGHVGEEEIKVVGFMEGKIGKSLIMMNIVLPEDVWDYVIVTKHTLVPALWFQRGPGSVGRLELGRPTDRSWHPENNEAAIEHW